jgi:hypothetical protein
MGMGDAVDPSKGQELPPGSYVKLPRETRHYEWFKGETIVHIHGIGPVGITYVNPAGDPRQKH